MSRNGTAMARRRTLGAFYTPSSATDYMAEWLVRRDQEFILEPSFGDGIFLKAVHECAERKNLTPPRLLGVEIDDAARARLMRDPAMAGLSLHGADFTTVTPVTVDSVIGNPPYVRLRHLDGSQRDSALRAAGNILGQAMDPSGSLWMPFILHAMRFLTAGGRMALVLPYDFTYVRYARPLWAALSDHFGSLQVLRTHERLFPEILQDVVILLADDYGKRTGKVRYQAFERVQDLYGGDAVVSEAITIEAIIDGERPFVHALLGDELRDLLRTRIAPVTVPARQRVTFNIGYVSGDKRFFHPTPAEIQEYQIPERSLLPSITSSRMLKGIGLHTSSLGGAQAERLFLPDPGSLTDGERQYVALGEGSGVSDRFKCRVREPWYVVPGVKTPDVILSVFTERPVLLINDARCFASNSLLCGYCEEGGSGELAAAWYTSLTLLQCELEVHSLGGGVMVMVPGEAGRVRLPKYVTTHEDRLRRIDTLLRAGRVAEVYSDGDQDILVCQLGLSDEEVTRIRRGVKILAHWRTASRPIPSMST